MTDTAERGTAEPSLVHLLHRAGQCADEMFADAVGESQLTPRQFEVLKAASVNDDVSQTALVAATGIDRSTLADIVRRLVDRGFLQRRRTRRDARMYAVRVTAAGQTVLGACEPIVRDIEDRLLRNVPMADRKALVVALGALVEGLGPISSARVGAAARPPATEGRETVAVAATKAPSARRRGRV